MINQTLGRWIVALLGLTSLTSLACIAYDQEIGVLSQDYNESPVRIVESVFVSSDANKACAKLSNDELQGCPVAQAINEQLPHILDYNKNPAFRFCSCRSNQRRDRNALPAFQLKIEDQDENDRIYAALLLDSDANNSKGLLPDVTTYAQYVDPDNELLVDESSAYGNEVLNRPAQVVRKLEVGYIDGHLDLCNGAEGRPIEPGWHTLTVLATDRAWFKAEMISQRGVPDLARGATHDAVTFSFFCDKEAPEGQNTGGCTCEEPQATD